LNVNPTVGDAYSGLATLLANLIAKYADVLELEDDKEEQTQRVCDAGSNQEHEGKEHAQAQRRACEEVEKQQPGTRTTTVNNHLILNTPQGSLTQASLHFSIANEQAA